MFTSCSRFSSLGITWLRLFCFPLHTVAACLLLHLSVTMTVNQAIEILREHRGGGAIQTVKVLNCFAVSPILGRPRMFSVLPFEVKPRLFPPQQQYNFLHEFREKYAAYQESRAEARVRSVSRWSRHQPTFENFVVLRIFFFLVVVHKWNALAGDCTLKEIMQCSS